MMFAACLEELIHVSRFCRRSMTSGSRVLGLALIFWQRIRPRDGRRHKGQGGGSSALALEDHVVEDDIPKILLAADAI